MGDLHMTKRRSFLRRLFEEVARAFADLMGGN